MSRVLWLTGASSGIGRSVALAYAREGWTVAATARSTETLRDLAAEAAGSPGQIHIFAADVTDRTSLASAFSSLCSECGVPDLVILNAGTHKPTGAAGFSATEHEMLMAVNYLGVVNGLQIILPVFMAARAGQVAVVASVAGLRGLPHASGYAASKAAVIALCESLKPELDQCNVRLSLIMPGFVKTPLTDRNDFPMPFLMDVEKAARRIVDGIARGQFEITFPRRFTWLVKAMRFLPYWLYFVITRRMVRS